jgi:hypothetical protein
LGVGINPIRGGQGLNWAVEPCDDDDDDDEVYLKSKFHFFSHSHLRKYGLPYSFVIKT